MFESMRLIYINEKTNKKTGNFAECIYLGTQQSDHFSSCWKIALPSANAKALGKVALLASVLYFAESVLAHGKALPSA